MKRINKIALNEYDETILSELLLNVISDKYDEFASLLVEAGIHYTAHSDKEDADFLMWNCPSVLKEHIYYKSVLLYSELTSAQGDEE